MTSRLVLTVATLLLTLSVQAADPAEFRLIIKNHQFEPATLTVPAETKFKLIVENQDPTPEEFESHLLNREKIIPANSKATLFLGPLKAGSYPFIGEFHSKTATGTLIVK